MEGDAEGQLQQTKFIIVKNVQSSVSVCTTSACVCHKTIVDKVIRMAWHTIKMSAISKANQGKGNAIAKAKQWKVVGKNTQSRIQTHTHNAHK